VTTTDGEEALSTLDDDELNETIDRLLQLSEFDEIFREHFALPQKIASLEVTKGESELEGTEYDELVRRHEELKKEINEALEDVEDDELFASAMYDS